MAVSHQLKPDDERIRVGPPVVVTSPDRLAIARLSLPVVVAPVCARRTAACRASGICHQPAQSRFAWRTNSPRRRSATTGVTDDVAVRYLVDQPGHLHTRPAALRRGGSGSASAVSAEVWVSAIAASRRASSTSSAVALSAVARAAATCSWLDHERPGLSPVRPCRPAGGYVDEPDDELRADIWHSLLALAGRRAA
jgi:hypothetical protein